MISATGEISLSTFGLIYFPQHGWRKKKKRMPSLQRLARLVLREERERALIKQVRSKNPTDMARDRSIPSRGRLAI